MPLAREQFILFVESLFSQFKNLFKGLWKPSMKTSMSPHGNAWEGKLSPHSPHVKVCYTWLAKLLPKFSQIEALYRAERMCPGPPCLRDWWSWPSSGCRQRLGRGGSEEQDTTVSPRLSCNWIWQYSHLELLCYTRYNRHIQQLLWQCPSDVYVRCMFNLEGTLFILDNCF